MCYSNAKSRGSCGSHGMPFPNLMHRFKNFMPYDLSEMDDEYIITIALPGFDIKDIEVSVKGSNVLIEALKEKATEKSEPAEPKKEPRKIVSMGHWLWDRPIHVSIPVDDDIVADQVKAKLNKGLLTIRFKKAPKHKIDIEE
jgi:HSP20 family protein